MNVGIFGHAMALHLEEERISKLSYAEKQRIRDEYHRDPLESKNGISNFTRSALTFSKEQIQQVLQERIRKRREALQKITLT